MPSIYPTSEPISDDTLRLFPRLSQRVFPKDIFCIDRSWEGTASAPVAVWRDWEIDTSLSDLSEVIFTTEIAFTERVGIKTPFEFERKLSVKLPKPKGLAVVKSRMLGFKKLQPTRISEGDLLFYDT